MCNCRIKSNCLVNGKLLTKGVIYKATVSHKNKNHIYIGSTGREFTSRYYEHIESFRNEIKKENTRLSRFIDKIKNEKNKNENIDLNNIIKGNHSSN